MAVLTAIVHRVQAVEVVMVAAMAVLGAEVAELIQRRATGEQAPKALLLLATIQPRFIAP